jgi:dienelactone hydrolase
MIRTLALLQRFVPLGCLAILVIATASRGKIPEPGVPAPGQAGEPTPAVDEKKDIPREVLLGMYRAELGERYKDADADKLLKVQDLIEQYFDADSAGLRKQAVEQLKASGVAADIIGRLTHIRLHWPALEGGVYYVNEKRGPYTVRYFLGVPAGYDRAKPWPLVIKLPPVDPFIVNPPPDADAVVKIYNDWIKDELVKHNDALVLMPLLNLDELYGPSYKGMNSVIQPMLHAADRVNIDPTRVYLYGHSTGGHAAWNLGLHYATYFASIAPLAGGASQEWQRLRLPNLRNTPPVVWADAKDTIVKPEASRKIVEIMRNLKLEVDYVETKNLGHMPSDAVAEERYKKMRSFTRKLYPTWVTLQTNRPEVMFNRLDWIQLWQQSETGDEEHSFFRHGTGHMTTYKRSAKIDAKRDGNTITLTLDNVESLRIYLNDQMVDLSKELTIIINKTKTIHGYAKPNIDQMMNDQLFIGRGWFLSC